MPSDDPIILNPPKKPKRTSYPSKQPAKTPPKKAK